MSDTHEDRRKSDRRKTPRRAHDLLEDILTEEEKQQYDKMLWSERQCTDKRAGERLSSKGRRGDD